MTLEMPNLHHYAVMHALAEAGSAVFETAAKLLSLSPQ